MFAADLNHHGYVVIEVGAFPGPGKDVDPDPTISALRGRKHAALRPVDADTIAQIVAGKQDVPARYKYVHRYVGRPRL